MLIQAQLTRESAALQESTLQGDFRRVLELAPRLLEELMKVILHPVLHFSCILLEGKSLAPTTNNKMTCVLSCAMHLTHLIGSVKQVMCIAHDKDKCHLPIGGWSPRLQTCLESNFVPFRITADCFQHCDVSFCKPVLFSLND